MEYLAVVRLRALIAQEADVEQAKAREVTLKRAIHKPVAAANEIDNQSENAHRDLIKAGEIPALPRMPVQVSPQSQSLDAMRVSRWRGALWKMSASSRSWKRESWRHR